MASVTEASGSELTNNEFENEWNGQNMSQFNDSDYDYQSFNDICDNFGDNSAYDSYRGSYIDNYPRERSTYDYYQRKPNRGQPYVSY